MWTVIWWAKATSKPSQYIIDNRKFSTAGVHDLDGNLVGKGDFETQVRQVCENLKNIMEEAGGNLQNIVKKTTFLTHYSYIETYRRVRSEYFPEPCPPNTLLIIESLALPEYMIEVEAIAVLD